MIQTRNSVGDWPKILWFVVVLLIFAACAKKPSVAPRPIIKAGSLVQGPIRFELAIYYLPAPERDPHAALKELLDSDFKQWTLKATPEREPHELTLATRFLTDVKSSYPVPPTSSLSLFGKGLSEDQGRKLQDSRSALVLDFAYDKGHVLDGLRSAYDLEEELARVTGGLIWDDETREMFSPDAWHAIRIAAWKSDVPDISKNIIIHAYKKETMVREITLGMVKFGLPDIVVDETSWESNSRTGILINLFAQTLAEGAAIEHPGSFTLDLKKIRCAEVREPQIKSLKRHALGTANLALYEGQWEEGDPRNRLVAIDFDRYEGPDRMARQSNLLGEFFGWSDTVAKTTPSKALREASERARAKLPQLRADFNARLAPGELIMVKVPFTKPDGENEYMWVEVLAWNDSKINGLLRNEPFYVVGMHEGQAVNLDDGVVFDYLRKRPDGSMEGNETGRIIEEQGSPEETR